MRFGQKFLFIVTAFAFCAASTNAVARASVQFWAPLTPFELEVLTKVEAARSGDADTLLALALIASGDIRTHQAYGPIQQRIHRFVQQVRPKIDQQFTVYAKGRQLFGAMHDHFFGQGALEGESELIRGYDAQQSQMSTIFKTGQFNCVSSAILFMVLARYFDLHIEGVVTTQHVFVQIRDGNSRPIEVETTSTQGYGVTHDKAFYEKSFRAFSLSRDLEVPTYEDYLRRRLVPSYRLIAENMNHQHTMAARMDHSSRQRLYEMLGFIDRDTPASQLIRLNALHNEAVALLNARDTSKLDRLSQVIAPVMAHVQHRPWIQNRKEPKIQAVRNRLGSINALLGHLYLADKQFLTAEGYYGASLQWTRDNSLRRSSRQGRHKAQAFQAFEDRRWHAAIDAYQKLLSLTSTSDAVQYRQTKENIAAAYWNWANSAGEHSQWQEAADHYRAVIQWTQKADTIRKANAAQSKAEAMHHFNLGNWDQAIAHFKRTLTIENNNHPDWIRLNIGAAYINWGNALFYKQQYGPALKKYESALGTVDADKKAVVYQNITATYQKLTIPLVDEGKVAEAKNIMEKGVQRFPGCGPCQDEVIRLNQMLASQKKS